MRQKLQSLISSTQDEDMEYEAIKEDLEFIFY